MKRSTILNTIIAKIFNRADAGLTIFERNYRVRDD